MISTPINELLGIEYPIFQGGMAWVADASLAAGVSNAGGLGIIAGMNSNGEQLREEIKKARELDGQAVWSKCNADEPLCGGGRKSRYRRKNSGCDNRCGKPCKIYEGLECGGH